METKKKKKIMMVTFMPHSNFGTCLQSYALNTVLRKMGHSVEFIYNNNDFPKRGIIGSIKDIIKFIIPNSFVESYWRLRRRKASKGTRKTVSHNNSEIEGRHTPPIIISLPNNTLSFYLSKFPFYYRLMKVLKYRSLQMKKVYSYTFEDDNYKMRRIYTKKDYETVVSDADLFITGSDQIWNPYCCGFNPFMFLEFVNGRKKCIAYSSSISRPFFPPEIENRVKNDLKQFQHIAVREKDSVDLLNKLLNRKDIQLVVDPTYLLSAEEWITFGEKAHVEFQMPSRYILCYFIGNRYNDYIEMVEHVKNKTCINSVITIDCTKTKINYGNGIIYKDGGPYEFIYLLSHASFICMDSFHATVFALKFKIDFTHIMKTSNDNSENSQNKRMYDLFDRYNLHYKEYNKDNEEWLRPINWNHVDNIISKEIKDSLIYLENAI